MCRRVCIMGCRLEKDQHIHNFPKDAKRRSEWCQILGIYPRMKHVYLCSAHFANCYMYGNRISRYALPNPPESRKLNAHVMAMTNSAPITTYFDNGGTNNSIIVYPQEIKDLNDSGNNTSEAVSSKSRNINAHLMSMTTKPITNFDGSGTNNSIIVCPQEKIEDLNYSRNNMKSETVSPETNETITHDAQMDNTPHNTSSVENGGKVENFEIRKGDTNDMIIKGRYVQTNDYLVVSYTPPRKWSLHEQIKKLDLRCGQQLREIRSLNREKNRLNYELNRYSKLLAQYRQLMTKNRYILAELKIYKLQEAKRRKRRMERKHKERDIDI